VVPRSLVIAGVINHSELHRWNSFHAGCAAFKQDQRLGGFMTAIDFLCRQLGLTALIAPVAILVGISNAGAAAAYLSSTARLPFVVGINHYLPAVFGRIHPRWKTPYSLSFPTAWRELCSGC